MFNYNNVHSVVATIPDPTADGTLPVWKVPTRYAQIEILEAWASLGATIADGAGTTIVLTLFDKGTAGTATAGTMSSGLGNAGTGDWTINVPRNFTISEGTLDGGDYVCLKYDETGTVGPIGVTVGINYVSGVGA